MAHGTVRRESVETEMHKSEDQSKTFLYTKKRGYDVTRNPHLNKVNNNNTAASACRVFVLTYCLRATTQQGL